LSLNDELLRGGLDLKKLPTVDANDLGGICWHILDIIGQPSSLKTALNSFVFSYIGQRWVTLVNANASAHNPKVVGSNPTPATILTQRAISS